MNDKEKESLEKMREAIDAMTSSYTNMLNALPEENTATRAMLEKVIPTWDTVSQSKQINPHLQWGVLLGLTSALNLAVFDLDERITRLENGT
ncbi:hypothetical protein [Corynebacterium glutamicum]|uniref:hypothetical protein n=1 Tax=Corynebacterium glutamicum TaxID=1718 RepID=UPI001465EAF9|nr:hypothetical protein [Corynebacterium glutamicum]GFK19187.1 hypothetical protein KbCgl_17590 [Corynebacterium glutamicum]GFK19261.1 hypothetical protein KbCgl_18330 [Corynebacterium glutamicum]